MAQQIDRGSSNHPQGKGHDDDPTVGAPEPQEGGSGAGYGDQGIAGGGRDGESEEPIVESKDDEDGTHRAD